MVVLSKVRSATCSQLPGERPTDVEDAPAPARQPKHDDDDDDDDDELRYIKIWASTRENLSSVVCE